ncbi:MipA/OmpV family protein [Motiliproteus sp. MSK22-1]|uniref:MipA/OmpV family protein n=1 Tax=Motiliproteus sp. MSK22-1 TaxID=1897630 RepID=UPI0013016F0E|nr:MipA/OmpV family protein [Motiliproteus sp. MSK22-1]
MDIRTVYFLPLIFLLALSKPAISSESPGLRIGVGVAAGHDVFVDTDRRVDVVPLVFYRQGNFYIDGSRAGYEFYQTGAFKVAVQLQVRREGFDPDDSEALKDFEDHDSALEAGFLFSYDWFLGQTSFFGGFDVSSAYDGDVMRLQHAYPIHYDDFVLVPYVAATRRDRELNVYYYGVKPEEATARFPQFNSDDDTSYELGVNIDYRLSQRWGVIGSLAYEQFHNSIADSPIVEDDSSFKSLIGVTYQF